MTASPAPLDRDDLPREAVKSGYEFLTRDTQNLQDDDFANPGFLWVDRGRDLFNAIEAGGSLSCASCHDGDGVSLSMSAATHPKIDQASGELVNLEGRVNLCRERHQSLPPLVYESENLLSLTAYVAHQSRGAPMSVAIDDAVAAAYQSGRDYFFTRKGQLNLACSQCHDDHWGAKLRGDTISQGHSNGFPTYRLEWQTLGSLHRRFQDCDVGVRAEPFDAGSDIYVALELYLAARASGLEIETPAVRR